MGTFKLLIGFMAGVAIGVLFAPERGSSTRRKLLKKNRYKVDWDRREPFGTDVIGSYDDFEEMDEDEIYARDKKAW